MSDSCDNGPLMVTCRHELSRLIRWRVWQKPDCRPKTFYMMHTVVLLSAIQAPSISVQIYQPLIIHTDIRQLELHSFCNQTTSLQSKSYLIIYELSLEHCSVVCVDGDRRFTIVQIFFYNTLSIIYIQLSNEQLTFMYTVSRLLIRYRFISSAILTETTDWQRKRTKTTSILFVNILHLYEKSTSAGSVITLIRSGMLHIITCNHGNHYHDRGYYSSVVTRYVSANFSCLCEH